MTVSFLFGLFPLIKCFMFSYATAIEWQHTMNISVSIVPNCTANVRIKMNYFKNNKPQLLMHVQLCNAGMQKYYCAGVLDDGLGSLQKTQSWNESDLPTHTQILNTTNIEPDKSFGAFINSKQGLIAHDILRGSRVIKWTTKLLLKFHVRKIFEYDLFNTIYAHLYAWILLAALHL